MFKQTGNKKSGNRKCSWKKIWTKLLPKRTTDSVEGGSSLDYENLPSSSRFDPTGKRVWTSKKEDGDAAVDIHEIDKDRIRTCCKGALINPPEFPSREEVKEKIENAHKYYGIKCMYNYYERSDEPSSKKELQPSWYYILERPLVEQYVLMNNYIRKLSVQASLKKEQSGAVEESAVEEEVSSISSLSDYEDFASDSKIAAKLKELKKIGAKDSLPSQIGASRLEQELGELKRGSKSKERTVQTNEYTIVIREPTKPEMDNEKTPKEVLPSSSNAIEFGEVQGETVEPDLNSSGDHLPDMKDFDLSYNLVDGPVIQKARFGRPSYYHWQGNSTPTKTPLLNMDCQPPVRPRAAGTARDFLSFRNLSLSSEFVDSCRDFSVAFSEECRSAFLKELAGSWDVDDLGEGSISSATQTDHKNVKPLLSLTWEDRAVNCQTASPEECVADMTQENSIVERAALASDYYRECGNQGMEIIEEVDVVDIDPSHVLEDTLGHQFEDSDILRTSLSQMDNDDLTEASTSSMETQILATPRNLN